MYKTQTIAKLCIALYTCTLNQLSKAGSIDEKSMCRWMSNGRKLRVTDRWENEIIRSVLFSPQARGFWSTREKPNLTNACPNPKGQ